MDLKVTKEGTTGHFTFNVPKLDFYAISNIEKQLIAEFADCEKIVFNMENTEFIVSAFIRLCLVAIQKVGKDNFEIINACKFIRTVLRVAKFDNFVKVSG